jgi:uncharacterized repeat protein (TIGR03803 family)
MRFPGGIDGSYPDSGLTAGPDGDFYGTTTYGGARNLGTVYRITPAGAHTVLYSFTGGPGDGQYPASGLELGTDGAFYATTTAGGAFGVGTFFRIPALALPRRCIPSGGMAVAQDRKD